MELWLLAVAHAPTIARTAARAEADGWAGLAVADTQSLAGDCYTALGLAATATSRLGLATGVTNPVTRHPAVAAAAAATVHAASGGRMVLGVGRGDSALAHVGLSPAPVGYFARWLAVVRAYLRGASVAFDDLRPFAPAGGVRPVDDLPLGAAPEGSRLGWVAGLPAPVPVEVAATGPAVIALAARAADRVMLALGADPERLAWGIEAARAAGPAEIGAYVNVVCHPDPAAARALAAGGVASIARFSVMHGTLHSPASDAQREVFARLPDSYDMTRHTRVGTEQASVLTDEFVDGFAIAGPPAHCIERLREIEALGVGKVVIMGPTAGTDRDEARRAERRLAEEVVPAFAAGRPALGSATGPSAL